MDDTAVVYALNYNPIPRKRVSLPKFQSQSQPRGIGRQSGLIRIGFAWGSSPNAR